MTPERAAGLVARWVRWYTRGLPAEAALRRTEEIDADLYDHIAYERACATADRRIALGVLSRMVRGLPADVSWRRRARSSPQRPPAKGNPVKFLLVFLAFLLGAAGVAGVVLGEADDSPGLQFLGALLVVGALVFGTRTVRR